MVFNWQVESRKQLWTSESIEYSFDAQQRVCVFLRNQVKYTVFNGETPASVGLFDQNGGACKWWRWGGLHHTSALQFVHFCFEHPDLLMRNEPYALAHKTTVADVDNVIDQIRALEIFRASWERLAVFYWITRTMVTCAPQSAQGRDGCMLLVLARFWYRGLQQIFLITYCSRNWFTASIFPFVMVTGADEIFAMSSGTTTDV